MLAFNQKVSFAMDKAMQHLSDTIFIQMANMTLFQLDSHLDRLKLGMKLDMFAHLQNSPLQIRALICDDVFRCSEDEMAKHDSSHTSKPGWGAKRFSGKHNNNKRQPDLKT